MPIIELVILLACLVLLSNVLSHYLVAIPVSLIQVGLGLGAVSYTHLTLPTICSV